MPLRGALVACNDLIACSVFKEFKPPPPPPPPPPNKKPHPKNPYKKMPNPAAAPFVLGAAALSGAAYYYNNNRRRSSASSLASSDGADLKTYNVNYNPAGNAQQQTTAKPYFSETHPQYGKDLRWAQDATRPGSWKWV